MGSRAGSVGEGVNSPPICGWLIGGETSVAGSEVGFSISTSSTSESLTIKCRGAYSLVPVGGVEGGARKDMATSSQSSPTATTGATGDGD